MLPSTSKIDLAPCEGGKQPPLARLQGDEFCGTRNFDMEEGGEECVRSNGGSGDTISAHRKRMFLHLSEENANLLERIKILEGRQSPQNEAIFISPRMRLRDFGGGVVSQDWLTRSSSCPLPSKSTPDFVQRARPNSRKEYVCSVGQEMSVSGRQCTEEIRTAALVLAEIALEMIHAQELGPSSENKSCEVVDRRRYHDDLIDQTDEIVAVLEEEVRGLHRWASIACEHTRVEDGATLHSDQLLGTAISNETISTPLGENEDCHGGADEIDWQYGASTASSKEAAESEILLNPIILTCRLVESSPLISHPRLLPDAQAQKAYACMHETFHRTSHALKIELNFSPAWRTHVQIFPEGCPTRCGHHAPHHLLVHRSDTKKV